MTHINIRKRSAHRRRVHRELHAILNDPAIMPNADCPDLVVSVSRVEFGNTVAQIFIEVHPRWTRSIESWAEYPHDKYMREARASGRETYIDIDEIFFFPAIIEVVSKELQKRLGLTYTPVIRLFKDLGRAEGR